MLPLFLKNFDFPIIYHITILKMRRFLILFLNLFFCFAVYETQGQESHNLSKVNPMIGTGGNGRVSPVACVPFGMVQVGVDTRMKEVGYHYDDEKILGISHVHKSGGGCNDFLDILFQPVPGFIISESIENYPLEGFSSSFSHQREKASPGYYSVSLDDFDLDLELTATSRCAFHLYTYSKKGKNHLLIDLKYGSTAACTIVPQDDQDTVKVAGIEMIDQYTVAGFRISNGWAPEQHVYFYARFSEPIKDMPAYLDNKLKKGVNKLKGTDVKAILEFDTDQELYVEVGISPVSIEGAKKNLEKEIAEQDFETIKKKAQEAWSAELDKIDIESENEALIEIFYTSLYNSLMYPMLYSDVDGKFRGPDFKVHQTDGFNYYGGVIGVWDTFRAACPLLTIVKPKVANDYVRTMLAHYKIFGQLPIWTLAGGETFQMIGLQSIPVIADCYNKGIRNYDTELAFEAMKQSAMKDTCGFSMLYFVGLQNYKKYGYVPADLEMESVARTLEYAYDDWCVAQMAQMLNKTADYNYFINRSNNYKNVYDPSVGLMRGKLTSGQWRTPFDPFASNHRRDDYCEGNAWQWTFFVPHDVEGLAELMGGQTALANKLDTLFTMNSAITGEDVSGDISGLIGQYAHGNEPGHHTAYMYTYLDQAWKTQKYVRQILETMYQNTPEGICGNEDTGQMSAWFVWSSMGVYPVRHGNGEYMVGTPLFSHLEFSHDNGKLEINAPKVSAENMFIKSIYTTQFYFIIQFLE